MCRSEDISPGIATSRQTQFVQIYQRRDYILYSIDHYCITNQMSDVASSSFAVYAGSCLFWVQSRLLLIRYCAFDRFGPLDKQLQLVATNIVIN
jgi:hypothetical protein